MIYKTISIDTNENTALDLYLKLANNPYSYLFESVEGGEKYCYSSVDACVFASASLNSAESCASASAVCMVFSVRRALRS
jgi:hypothetical protein